MTKKLFYFVIAAALICGASVFTSCTNDDNPIAEPDLGVADKIIGKWMMADQDGQAMPTNEKIFLHLSPLPKPTGVHHSTLIRNWVHYGLTR